MKLGKAILMVKSEFGVSNRDISIYSGVSYQTIGNLLRGGLKSTSWDKIERLANGFGRIHPSAKAFFILVLFEPDTAYPDEP